jgi:uncharacterized protein (DUF885 family)
MDALTKLADDYYAYATSASPLGLMGGGKLDHLEEWDDFSPAAVEGRKARYLTFAEAADALDIGDEPRDIALRDSISTGARSAALGLTWNAELFQVSPKMGLVEMCLSFIGSYPLKTTAHGEQYLEKLRRMPGALAVLADAANAAAAEGRIATARQLGATADSIDAYLATPPGPDERLCCQEAPTTMGAKEAGAWREARDAIVATTVREGLAAYGAALRALARHGRPDEKSGLCHLPGGLDVYRDAMWANLLTEHTAQEVHQIGLNKVAELEDEYRAIAGPLLGLTDVSDIYARLRDDKALVYTSPEAIVADAEAALARAGVAAATWFGTMPASKCPAHATDYGAMAYYSTPDLEIGKEAAFYFNTSNPSAWSTYELEAITFHEAIPGHHLQFALHAENPNLHNVQKDFFNTAYAEGWGLYAERLADEMGLYSSELDRLGMLSGDSLRACRLVVDTGMHAFGWGREEAIQYMVDHSPMHRSHIEQEVDRYIALPGQALAYMIGRIEIQAIRTEAEARPGFDIREFHDSLLRYGPVPLPTLRRLILGA